MLISLSVDLNLNAWDVKCLKLARLGFTLKSIASQCQLSVGQVSYRLRLAGLSTMSYRRGLSREARQVMFEIQQTIDIDTGLNTNRNRSIIGGKTLASYKRKGR